jgi:hypothetical protein
MGNSASTSELKSLKSKVTALETKTKDYATLKTQVADASSNLAKSVDYEALAKKITDVSSYNDKVAAALAKNPGVLGEGLAAKMGKDDAVATRIVTGLQDNTAFAKILSDKLTDETGAFRDRLRGDKGAPGELASSQEAVKKALYDTKYTMWCADGDICKVPASNKGIKIGDTVLSQADDWVRLLSNPDDKSTYNRGVAAKNLWAKDNLWVNNRDVLAELDSLNKLKADFYWTLENNMVRRDKHYAIATRHGYFQAADGCHNHDGCKGRGLPLFDGDNANGAYEKMKFHQRND